MNTKTEKRVVKKSTKRKIILAFVAVVLLSGILLILNSIDFNTFFDEKEKSAAETPVRVHLYEPDFDEDILQDEYYLAKNRYLLYTDGATSAITSGKNEFGITGAFFYRYFDALIHGDAETLNDMYMESFFSAATPRWERITMQKVYDMEVELLNETVLEDGEYTGWIRYLFKVGYRIMENNGTFRSDLESDALIPQIYELLSDGETIRIHAVSNILNAG